MILLLNITPYYPGCKILQAKSCSFSVFLFRCSLSDTTSSATLWWEIKINEAQRYIIVFFCVCVMALRRNLLLHTALVGTSLVGTSLAVLFLSGGSARAQSAISCTDDAGGVGSNSLTCGAGTTVGTSTTATAIGTNASANAGSATAIGASASASAPNSVAIGAASSATAANTVSIGSSGSERRIVHVSAGIGATDAVNRGQLDAAITTIPLATNNTLGLAAAVGTGQNSLAIGWGASATTSGGSGALAVGNGAGASANTATAIGFYAQATANTSLALGAGAEANAVNAVAIGANSIAGSTNTVSFGSSGNERRLVHVAAGSAATDGVNKGQLDAALSGITTTLPFESTNTSLLATPSAVGNDTLALGWGSVASGTNSVAIGAGSTAGSANTVSFGSSGNERRLVNVAAATSGTDAVNKNQLDAVVSGWTNTLPLSANNTASLSAPASSGTDSLAIGWGASATAANAVAIGAGSVAGASNTVSIGTSGNERRLTNLAAGSAATDAINKGQFDTALSGIAATVTASVTASLPIAASNTSSLSAPSASGNDAVALGWGAAANGLGSVAIGAGSVAGSANTVSFGSSGNERRLVNVAAATSATDAVNKSQLDSLAVTLGTTFAGSLAVSANNASSLAAPSSPGNDALALGWGATASATRSVALGSGSVASVANTASFGSLGNERRLVHVAAGVASTDGVNKGQLESAIATGISAVPLAGNNTASLAAPSASGANALAAGAGSSALGVQSSAFGSGAVANAANSVALGAGSVASAANTVSIGSAGNERRLMNLAAGVVATDGVNKGQLESAIAGVSGQIAAITLPSAADNTSSLAQASSSGADSFAGGFGSVSSGARSTALGSQAHASGNDALAIGRQAQATQNGAIAMGLNASSTGTNAIAIGSGASATGSVAVGAAASAANGGAAFGDGAEATGLNSTALGPDTRASHANATALGTGTQTSRDNEVAVGNAQNTYRMAGINTSQSRAAQSGVLKMVTSDAAGNLATGDFPDLLQLWNDPRFMTLEDNVTSLGGRVNSLESAVNHMRSGIGEAKEGAAIALALAGVTLPADKTFALSVNWANNAGENALAAASAMKLSEMATLHGGIGIGTRRGTVGARAGVTMAW
jgi:trimeric autotransporter adhesin